MLLVLAPVAAVSLVASLLTMPSTASAGTPTPSRTALEAAAQVAAADVPTLRWHRCRPRYAEFECTRARVPLDYDKPNGLTIRLALTRLPATDPAARLGSIFINPGGPGGSGVSVVQAFGTFLYSDKVRARFDLVGFDPRGVARSTPLQCFDTTEDAIQVLPPFAFPVTRAQERVWIHSDRAYARGCVRRAGAILDHMSTANVARDMDLLRRAVGDEMMNFAGYSYGSYIGSTYANLFPDKVRAVIIDGVIDPVSYATGRGDEAQTLPERRSAGQ